MRVIRMVLGMTTLAVSAVGALAPPAAANGGAYLDFARGAGSGTYFVPGDAASGGIALSIPERRQPLLVRGPFYVYLGRGARTVSEGRPVPDGLIRVGTASIVHRSGEAFVLRASFVVPDVSAGSYVVSVCNSPCTLSGFREPITGSIEVVATAREASLLVERDRLSAVARGLKRELRKAERSNEELQTLVSQAQHDNAWLADEVNRLNGELEAASAAGRATDERPLIATAPAVAIALALLLAAASLARRRRAAIRVPDTIEGLDQERPVAR